MFLTSSQYLKFPSANIGSACPVITPFPSARAASGFYSHDLYRISRFKHTTVHFGATSTLVMLFDRCVDQTPPVRDDLARARMIAKRVHC